MSDTIDKHHPGRVLNNNLDVTNMNTNIPLNRHVSRSNSTSSSTLTVRKSASLSSRNGPRSSYLRGRSNSPDSISKVLYSLNSSRQDLRIRPESFESKKALPPLGGNRWSHSTSSSTSGLDTDLIRKRTSSSGATRRSVAGFTSTSQGLSSQETVDSKISSTHGRPIRPSTGNAVIDTSRPNIQDPSKLSVARDRSQPRSNTSNADFFNHTWEHRSGYNKFGEPVQAVSVQYTPEPSQQVIGGQHLDRKVSPVKPGHRDRSANRSKDTSHASISSARSDQSRGRGHRSPKQKDMLSKALAKANTAVLLDNAQNVIGAIEAYNEACTLLEQVMIRSTDMDDRKKLSSIRTTYSNRIAELHDQDNTFADLMDKALPEDPPLTEYDQPEDFYHDDSSFHSRASKEFLPSIQLPLRQESLIPQIFGGEHYLQDRSLAPVRETILNSQLKVPMDSQYMPSPLSPRHPVTTPTAEEYVKTTPTQQLELPPTDDTKSSVGSTSWLDNYDGSSTKSSSRLSSIDFGQQNGQLVSDIEAEFDAAMSAAVDFAYDDEQLSQEPTPRVAERSVDSFQQPSTQLHPAQVEASEPTRSGFDQLTFETDDESQEEERLLDEITKRFDSQESTFNVTSPSNVPRQSDSSGFSSRTWGSSVASTTATSGTALSTLSEATEPISTAVPPVTWSTHYTSDPIPHPTSQAPGPNSSDRHIPIRDRRLSGQSAKQLKIETFSRRTSISKPTVPLAIPAPQIEEPIEEIQTESHANPISFSSSFSSTQPLTPLASITSGDSARGDSPATPALTQGGSIDDGSNLDPSPARSGKMMPPPITRKNVSSSNLKKGSLSINTTDILESPITPGSAIFPGDIRRRPSTSTSAVPTPGGTILTSTFGGGLYLFDDHVGSSQSPGSPEMDNGDLVSLEPCPDSFLLRPFWLMRCLYNALSQPHGGYVTQKLFISRDIWRVRNVKIKALDEKVATCDILTAALQKLGKVDTLDAAAVLEEIQSFETVLDQIRTTLTKKLGSDVGLAGTTSVFKNSPAGDDSADAAPLKGTNSSSAAKSIASGWRKLRSKSSSAALNSSVPSRDTGSYQFTMQSLPMTSSSSVATSRSYLLRNRNPPPTPSQLVNLIAPHAIYLSSLAQLFDAVQVLDSIARQVEDPGLKHSSKTHVGLELSVRNAAEFFAFYIIRFVMSDLLILVDKFLKRGSEWAMN